MSDDRTFTSDDQPNRIITDDEYASGMLGYIRGQIAEMAQAGKTEEESREVMGRALNTFSNGMASANFMEDR